MKYSELLNRVREIEKLLHPESRTEKYRELVAEIDARNAVLHLLTTALDWNPDQYANGDDPLTRHLMVEKSTADLKGPEETP